MVKSLSEKFKLSFLGKKISMVTIISIVPTKKGKGRVMGICECGVTKEYVLSALISGNTTSCGCYNRKLNTKHGKLNHPLYSIWHGMRTRCAAKSGKNYKKYSSVGVRVCDEWNEDFNSFYNWAISNGWEKGLQLDKDILSERKPGKLYSPKTCVFVTSKANNRHKSDSRILNYKGKSLCVADWADFLGVSHISLRGRLNNGWTVERTLTEPIKKIARNEHK